jgi:hypothetical protein
VFALIKSPESNISERVTGILALDDDLSAWWQSLRPDFKLNSVNIALLPVDQVSNVLLINLFYHQSLCALHASIIPLFSWSKGDETWTSARKLSAQVAFEHGCEISALNALALASGITARHTFVAYAAYSGCAIQIPFMWCSNVEVKARADANVRTNIQMIRTMAPYWKFAALLEIHVGYLYGIHRCNPPHLDDEPKNVDISKLVSFEIRAAYARASIIGFVEVLRSKGDGYSIPGQETKDLGIEESSEQRPSIHTEDARVPSSAKDFPSRPLPAIHDIVHDLRLPQHTDSPFQDQTQDWRLQSDISALPPSVTDYLIPEGQMLDVCEPFLDPTMLDLFPNGEIPDLSHLEPGILPLG